jgi:hypothetical protein
MSKRSALLLIFLGLFVLVIDHYSVNVYIKELEDYQIQHVASQSLDIKEVLVATNRRLGVAERKYIDYAKWIKQLQETNKQNESVIMDSAATIKDLTNDNAQTHKNLDLAIQILRIAYLKAVANEKELATLKDLNAQLRADMQWFRAMYEKKTGEVAPMPPNSLK